MKSCFYKSIIFIAYLFFLTGAGIGFCATLSEKQEDFYEGHTPGPIQKKDPLGNDLANKTSLIKKKVSFDLDRNTLLFFTVEDYEESSVDIMPPLLEETTSRHSSGAIPSPSFEPSWKDILSISSTSIEEVQRSLAELKKMLGGEEELSLEERLEYLSVLVGEGKEISILESLENFLRIMEEADFVKTKDGVSIIKVPTFSALEVATIDQLGELLTGSKSKMTKSPEEKKDLSIMPFRIKNGTKCNLIRLLNVQPTDTLKSQMVKLKALLGNFPQKMDIIESVEFFLEDVNKRLLGTFERAKRTKSQLNYFMILLDNEKSTERTLKDFYDRFCRAQMTYDYEPSEDELRAFHRLCNPKL